MEQSDPGAQSGEQPSAASRVRPMQLIGGLVLGFAMSWLVFAVVLLWIYASYGDSTSTTQDVIAVLGLVGLPVLLGLLLIPRRTRYWGAGPLMGVAIGSMTGAGACAGFLGINAV